MHYLIIRDWLAAADCDKIVQDYAINQKAGGMTQSTGYDPLTGESKYYNEHRTSQQVWLPKNDPYLSGIERRIAEATGLPVENGEGFQLAYYPAGCFFRGHHDYFDPAYGGSAIALAQGGQRLMTFMIYLNTLPEGCGGETSFVNADVKVRPEKGKALVFWNVAPDWSLDKSTLHEGLPPAAGYEKYILNKWIRQDVHR